jgi:enamine deaminase RidA (YjgF/YER057c/UK114 family)
MAGIIDKRLLELGIRLPAAASPQGNYVPWVVVGNLVFISGQLPLRDGVVIYSGRLGDTVSLEDGQQAAQLCGFNLIAQARAAVDGNLDRIARVVKLTGYVASTPDFTRQPQVMNGANGASELMVAVFGDAGKHARVAVSCPALPLGAAVEIDATFEIRS